MNKLECSSPELRFDDCSRSGSIWVLSSMQRWTRGDGCAHLVQVSVLLLIR